MLYQTFLHILALNNIQSWERIHLEKTMPRALIQNLKIMGEQILLARKRRHLFVQDIADRTTVTRLTVSKVEHICILR